VRLAAVATPAIERTALVRETRRALKALLAEVTNLPAERFDVLEALEAYGIDSLMIATLNERLSRIFGEISKTLLFEYQTLAELADYFADSHPAACAAWTSAEPTVAVAAPLAVSPVAIRERAVAPVSAPKEDAIAIIGLSGSYPQARTLEEFWANLKAGRDCVTEVPAERWSLDNFYDPDPESATARGRSYSKWGGFLSDFANFDPLFFNISPRDALNIDPQERLLLQSAWAALEDAGLTREALMTQYHQRVGVFVGITQTGFSLYGPELRARGEAVLPQHVVQLGGESHLLFLNVRGPSMPIDTMCSSSLTAVHEACERLRHGGCDLALAGGVNLYVHPSTYVGLQLGAHART